MNVRFPLTIAFMLAIFVAVFSLFWRENLILSFILILLNGVVFKFWHTRKDIIFFFVGFFIGPTTEMVCVYFGAWTYSNPTFLIPVWLPLAWGTAGILLGRLSVYFEEIWGSGK